MVRKLDFKRLILPFVALCLVAAIGWLAWAAVSPTVIQKRARQLLGRENVVATDSLHTPWLYVDPTGVVHIKRERLRGDTLIIPDAMNNVAVKGAVSTFGGAAYGIVEISFPSDIESVELWREHFPDLERIVFRDGVAPDADFTLRRLSAGESIAVYLPRRLTALDSDAFRGSSKDMIIHYEGTEQEWLAYGAEAEEVAATYTVCYESVLAEKK